MDKDRGQDDVEDLLVHGGQLVAQGAADVAEQRARLHVAAVFANNFSNFLFSLMSIKWSQQFYLLLIQIMIFLKQCEIHQIRIY